MKRFCAAALMLLAACGSAHAASGLDLYRTCIGNDSVSQLQCSAFVSGFMQALLITQKISPGAIPTMCMPTSNVVEGFVAWGSYHLDELARDQGDVLAAALFDPESCRQKSGLSILR